jgi:hypothetical protein
MAKSTSAKDKKIEVLHPNTGRKMNVDADTWKLFSTAIRHTLKSGKELTFTEIVEGIHDYLTSHNIQFKQSVEWYAVTVKNDLHVKNIIAVTTIKGRKMHSLAKK